MLRLAGPFPASLATWSRSWRPIPVLIWGHSLIYRADIERGAAVVAFVPRGSVGPWRVLLHLYGIGEWLESKRWNHCGGEFERERECNVYVKFLWRGSKRFIYKSLCFISAVYCAQFTLIIPFAGQWLFFSHRDLINAWTNKASH